MWFLSGNHHGLLGSSLRTCVMLAGNPVSQAEKEKEGEWKWGGRENIPRSRVSSSFRSANQPGQELPTMNHPSSSPCTPVLASYGFNHSDGMIHTPICGCSSDLLIKGSLPRRRISYAMNLLLSSIGPAQCQLSYLSGEKRREGRQVIPHPPVLNSPTALPTGSFKSHPLRTLPTV